jgi:tRNA_anti-like
VQCSARIGLPLLLLMLAGQVLSISLSAQDTVTIPKARLEELERKERELERLQGDVAKTKDENKALKTRLQEVSTNAAPAIAPPKRISPPIASLAALKSDEVVEAADLANYYHADAAAADGRFRGRKFSVTGEIVGFEKPLFRRNYRVLLQGNDRDTKVICDFYPPDKFDAVFSTQHGTHLVGQSGESRVPLAQVGQRVVVEGICQGWREAGVFLSAGTLKPILTTAP